MNTANGAGADATLRCSYEEGFDSQGSTWETETRNGGLLAFGRFEEGRTFFTASVSPGAAAPSVVARAVYPVDVSPLDIEVTARFKRTAPGYSRLVAITCIDPDDPDSFPATYGVSMDAQGIFAVADANRRVVERLDLRFLERWATYRLRIDAGKFTVAADGEEHTLDVGVSRLPRCRLELGIQGDTASVPPAVADYDHVCHR